MMCLSVSLFLVANLTHQEYLLWKTDIFWCQHLSIILYYGGFYSEGATAQSHKCPRELLIHTLHRFLNDWDWCLKFFWFSTATMAYLSGFLMSLNICSQTSMHPEWNISATRRSHISSSTSHWKIRFTAMENTSMTGLEVS